VERVVEQTIRRVFEGEKVPANEKIYSIFEEFVAREPFPGDPGCA
jgi:hypothetical protein